jgi:hypothetical protein
MSRKESIFDAIQRLPDDVDFRSPIEEIRILERIEAAEKAADEGRVRSHEEVRELIRCGALRPGRDPDSVRRQR